MTRPKCSSVPRRRSKSKRPCCTWFKKDESFTRHFGKAASDDAMFLLGSISKPINVTAVMTLFDQGKFQLDDRVKKFLPTFTGDGRDDVTIRHLLTHVSGLPDQLANNNELRKQHAPLTEFADAGDSRAPRFRSRQPDISTRAWGSCSPRGSARLVSGSDILTLVDRNVFQPLGMKHSAQGLGRFKLEEMVSCQMEGAAPNRGAAIRRPRSGIGTVPTGGSWALPGEERTLPRRTLPGSWASSWGPAARSSSPRRLG